MPSARVPLGIGVTVVVLVALWNVLLSSPVDVAVPLEPQAPFDPSIGHLDGPLPTGGPLRPGTPTAAPSTRKCVATGRGHRLWLRAGNVSDHNARAAIKSVARKGALRMLQAFGSDFYMDDGSSAPDPSSEYYTTVGKNDVLVTDACGRHVASGDSVKFDVVFTHVDAEVPGWFEKLNATFTQIHPTRMIEAKRFRDNGELTFGTRSILRHAGHLVRRIVFVVEDSRHMTRTLDNVTRALAKKKGVRLVVVKHADLFPNPDDLPTFNSHSIESVIHRVPGLTPFLLYLNDDFMLGRRMSWFDIVRPIVLEVPDGIQPGGPPTGKSRFVRLGTNDTLAGQYAVSAMTRRNTLKKGGTVWVEVEVIPYFEHELRPTRLFGLNVTASNLIDPVTINPKVAESCGPREYIMQPQEVKDLTDGERVYNIQATVRRTRALGWNYLGVNVLNHEAHKGHFIDRAHMEQMMEGDYATGEPPLIPQHHTNFTRASQFRRLDDVKFVFLTVWMTVADNWRRRKELFAQSFRNDTFLDEVFQCTECPIVADESDTTVQTKCWHRPPEDFVNIGLELMPKATDKGPRGTTAMNKLLSPVVMMVNQHPDYFYDNAANLADLRRFTGELLKKPRLWIALNDRFDTEDAGLSDALLKAFEKTMRVGTREPGCVALEES